MDETGPAEAKLLELAASTASNFRMMMEVQKYKAGRPKIDMNVEDDPDLLALARRAAEGGYAVEFNISIYFILYVLFFRLTSDRKIMPWIEAGPSSSSGGRPGWLGRYWPGSRGPKKSGPSFEAVWEATTPSDRPMDWGTLRTVLDPAWADDFWDAAGCADAGTLRGRIAHWMTEQAVQFLLAHEARHVLAGHVDYMKDKFGFTELNVSGATAKENHRAVEADADIYAIQYLLISLLATRKTKREKDAPALACMREDWHVLFVATLCVATVFYVLDSPDKPLKVSPYAKHPSFMVRRLFTFMQTNRLVHALGIDSIGYRDEKAREEVTIATVLWIQAEGLLAHLFGDEDPRAMQLADNMDEADREINQLIDSLKHVYKELERYAYIQNLVQYFGTSNG